MAVVTTKSPSIINLDALPFVINTVGEGGEGPIRTIGDTLTAVVGDSATSVYRFVRIPVNAKIKRLFTTVIGNTGTVSVDIDIAFSDSTSRSSW